MAKRPAAGCGRCVFRLLIAAALAVGLALAVRDAWLPYAALALQRDDAPRPGAPYLALLMGGIEERPAAAAAAFATGRAQNIVLAHCELGAAALLGLEKGESERSVAMLEALGVPEAHILRPWRHDVSSTSEELAELASSLTALEPRPERVILLTSWYHTWRAGRVFERRLQGSGIAVEVLPARPGPFTPWDWWHTERGLIAVFQEYVKIALYRWRGDL